MSHLKPGQGKLFAPGQSGGGGQCGQHHENRQQSQRIPKVQNEHARAMLAGLLQKRENLQTDYRQDTGHDVQNQAAQKSPSQFYPKPERHFFDRHFNALSLQRRKSNIPGWETRRGIAGLKINLSLNPQRSRIRALCQLQGGAPGHRSVMSFDSQIAEGVGFLFLFRLGLRLGTRRQAGIAAMGPIRSSCGSALRAPELWSKCASPVLYRP